MRIVDYMIVIADKPIDLILQVNGCIQDQIRGSRWQPLGGAFSCMFESIPDGKPFSKYAQTMVVYGEVVSDISSEKGESGED